MRAHLILILEQNPVLYGKITSAASRKFPKFPNHHHIAEDSLLISNSFTNNFKVLFCFAMSKFLSFYFQFHFAFILLPPPNAHGLGVNSLDGL